MTRRTRWIVATGLIAIGVVGAAWYFQSQIIGISAKLYLQNVASHEEESGGVNRRRRTVSRLHRTLLMAPPPDALVPELFDYLTQLSARTASGEISWAWSSYLYTSHLRTAVARPLGTPRASAEQLATEIQEGVDFFYLQQRPDAPGLKVKDLWGDGGGGESFTLEEIKQAAREGRDLTIED